MRRQTLAWRDGRVERARLPVKTSSAPSVVSSTAAASARRATSEGSSTATSARGVAEESCRPAQGFRSARAQQGWWPQSLSLSAASKRSICSSSVSGAGASSARSAGVAAGAGAPGRTFSCGGGFTAGIVAQESNSRQVNERHVANRSAEHGSARHLLNPNPEMENHERHGRHGGRPGLKPMLTVEKSAAPDFASPSVSVCSVFSVV